MNKKIKKFVLLGAFSITPTLTFAVSFTSFKSDYHEKVKFNDLNTLKKTLDNDFKDFERTHTTEEIEKEFQNLRKNKEILEWINNLYLDTEPKYYINEINDLNLNSFQKQIVLQQYVKHYNKNKSNNEQIRTVKHTTLKEYVDENNYAEKYPEIHNKIINNEYKYKDRFLRWKGFELYKVSDYVWGTDKTFISWSNINIYDQILEYIEIIEPDKKTIEKAFEDESSEKDNDEFLDQMIQIKAIESKNEKEKESLIKKLSYFKYLFKTRLSRYLNVYSIIKKDLLPYITGKPVNISSVALEQKIVEIIHKGLNLIESKVLPQSEKTKFVSKFLDIVKKGISQKNVSLFLKNLRFISFGYSALIFTQELKNLVSGIAENHVTFKNIYNVVVAASDVILGAAAAGLINSVPVAGQVASLLLFLGDIMLKTIHLGNGYSIYENWNDQGLNDWRYQEQNNKVVLLAYALDFSNDLRNGITWHVSDGWFQYPNLDIATSEKINGHYDYAKFKYFRLSNGNEFNFGNKIPYKEIKK